MLPILSGRAFTAAGAPGGTVSGATNATPIVITTTAAHNLQSGDQVQVINVGGNTAANTTAYAKVLTATTFGLYSDAALTVGVAGSGAYTSGGTVSLAADISGWSGDFTVRVTVDSLTQGKRVLLSVEDSVDGFATKQVLAVVNLQSFGPGATYSFKAYQLPSARFGVANARLRVAVQSIDAAATAQVSFSVE